MPYDPALLVFLQVCENSYVKISAVIIAGNEENRIGAAIESVTWADEVLVIDSESTDQTRAIAERLGARVITRPWPGFSAQKQFGVDAALHDWIFSLDADEIVSRELRSEILDIIRKSADTIESGYQIPRRSFYMGLAIQHSGWYPDWQLRLFNRGKAKWSDALVHESVKLDSGAMVGRLSGDIIHYSVESALQHHRMIGERYAPLAARQMFESGVKTSRIRIATAGTLAFFSTYFIKAGFLDGLPGFCIARFAAHHAFMKHLCLWEMQNKKIPD